MTWQKKPISDRLKAYYAKWRLENREKLLAYNKEYVKNNKAKLSVKAAEYRANNKEKIAATQKIYREKNKESLKIKKAKNKKPYHLFTEEQKKKAAEYNRKRYHEKKHDPKFMEIFRRAGKLYRDRKRGIADPVFLAKKSKENCAYAKRKRKADPDWVKKQLERQRAWRKKTKPKYDCEALAKKRYNERNKDKLRERNKKFSATEEGKKYFREWARKRRATPKDLIEAATALRKLKRAILKKVENEK